MCKFIKTHKIHLRILSLLLSIAMLFTCTVHSFAYFQKAYGTANNSGTNLDGNFFRLRIKAMDSKWSSTNNKRFILHTTWVGFNNESWIECGTMDGAIQEPGASLSYWKGSYTAQGIRNSSGTTTSYNEYKIVGPSANIDYYHTYQISRVSGPDSSGRYTWGAYVDYQLRRSYYTYNEYCHGPQVGLESNESTATSAQWNEHSLQRISNWSWNNWTRSATSFTQNNASASFINNTTGNSIYTSK